MACITNYNDYDDEDVNSIIIILAVIKMEGGTDFDLTVLDQVADEERDGNRSRNNSESIAMER